MNNSHFASYADAKGGYLLSVQVICVYSIIAIFSQLLNYISQLSTVLALIFCAQVLWHYQFLVSVGSTIDGNVVT